VTVYKSNLAFPETLVSLPGKAWATNVALFREILPATNGCSLVPVIFKSTSPSPFSNAI
jgi:hypothetical protein